MISSQEQQTEELREEYAVAVARTNQVQTMHYGVELPPLLDSLQLLSHNQCQYFTQLMTR